jgi:hypothetical protein
VIYESRDAQKIPLKLSLRGTWGTNYLRKTHSGEKSVFERSVEAKAVSILDDVHEISVQVGSTTALGSATSLDAGVSYGIYF